MPRTQMGEPSFAAGPGHADLPAVEMAGEDEVERAGSSRRITSG